MLRLEKFTIEDRKDYEALVFNEAAMRMNMGRVFTAQEAETFFAMVLNCNRAGGTTGFYRVCCRDGTHWTYIGMGALSENEKEGALEIEYMLLPQFWHRGYGTALVARLLALCGDAPVVAVTDPENVFSRRILRRFGFSFVRSFVNPDGEQAELYRYR